MLAGKRVHREIFVALVMALFVVAGMSRSAFAQSPEEEWTNYFTNANTTGGIGYIHITDPLESSSPSDGETCAMLYVFDVSQGLQECCGCPVTSDGLLTLQIGTNPAGSPPPPGDIGINAVAFPSGGVLTDGVLRLLSTDVSYTTSKSEGFAGLNPGVPVYYGITPGTIASYGGYETDGIGCDPATGNCCDPTYDTDLTPTLRSWVTHVLNTAETEDAFANITSNETDTDNSNLSELCTDIIYLGSGNGPCRCGIGS